MKNNFKITKLLLVTAICMLIAVAVPVGIHIARSSSDDTISTSQGIIDEKTDADTTTTDSETTDDSIETSTDTVDTDSSETTDDAPESDIDTTPIDPVDTTSSNEDTTDKPIDTDVSETDDTSKESTTTKPETTKPETTKPETTKPETTKPETTAPETQGSGTSNPPVTTPVVVQNADRETGISWDGVSPIIYTYPDGTTGTEIRIGATYETLPGKFITVTKYHMPKDPSNAESDEDLSLCSHCGKKAGDGTSGTCKRYWTGGDHICKNCGVTIPVSTCHTCNDQGAE